MPRQKMPRQLKTCRVLGREAEAHERFTAMYNGFTEGCETPDLMEARALLERLSDRRKIIAAANVERFIRRDIW